MEELVQAAMKRMYYQLLLGVSERVLIENELRAMYQAGYEAGQAGWTGLNPKGEKDEAQDIYTDQGYGALEPGSDAGQKLPGPGQYDRRGDGRD